MPIWMRNFHFLTVNSFKEKEKEQAENHKGGASQGKLYGPGGTQKDI